MKDVKATPITATTIWSWAKHTRRVDIATYEKSTGGVTWERLLRAVVPDLSRPIFLIGAPRSGTTFLGKCLANLPGVSYHYEPVATKAATRYIYEGQWGFRKSRFFYRQVYGWLMRIHLDGHLRFAEKTPQNCFIVPFLHRAFSDAQFIHIIRDGHDAALSHSKQPWLQEAARATGRRESGGYPYGPYARYWVEPERREEFEETSDIHRCIWAWRRHVQGARGGASTLPASQYYELRYEALIRDPSGEADRLLGYLEITDPISSHAFRKTASRAFADSIGRGRDELTVVQLRQVDAEAGPLLRELGYQT